MIDTIYEISLTDDKFSETLNDFILNKFYIKINLKQLSVITTNLGFENEREMNENKIDWLVVKNVYMDITNGTIYGYIVKGSVDDEAFYMSIVYNETTNQFWFNRFANNLKICTENFRFEFEPIDKDLYSYIADANYPLSDLKYYCKVFGSKYFLRIPFESIDSQKQEIYKSHLASKLPMGGTKLSDKITIDEVVIDISDEEPIIHQYNYTQSNIKTYINIADNKMNIERSLTKLDVTAQPLIEYYMEYAFIVAEDELNEEIEAARLKEEAIKQEIAQRQLQVEISNLANEIETKTPIRFKDDSYVGVCDGLDIEIITLYEDGTISILKNLKDTNSYEEFNVKDKENVLKFLNNTLKTETKDGSKFVHKVTEFSKLTIVDLIKYKDDLYSLVEDYEKLSAIEQENISVSQAYHKLDKLIDRIGNISQDRIDLYLQSIEIFESKLDQQSKENVFDHEDELSEDEKLLIKDKMTAFNEFLDGLETETTLELTEFRRVFIKKSLAKQYREFSKDVRLEINRIVNNMKTLNGKDLLAYLRKNLRMNDPFKAINHKVRINNLFHLPYRMCFWQGKDFLDREETKNDIYIYMFVSDHDKDIDKMNDIKPSKYVENDFDLFTLDIDEDADSVRLPELREQQFKIAAYNEGPVVVYGCAGSGKTLISIDQYWQLVTQAQEYNDSYIAYVTFQELLKDKAIECIESYGIDSFCYTLPGFFRFVTKFEGEYKDTNEMDFIDWYLNYYVEKGDTYGRKKDITHIADKPSVERIIYTYYRGIFKGSDKLWNSNPKYLHTLTYEQFKNEMKSRETFLQDHEIDDIYKVCTKYYDYCKENNLYDDNDWSIEVLKAFNEHRLHRVQNIIIDEVQDLTSLQLRAIITSLKAESLNIFFYGDPHQIVNPTIFDDSVLRTALKEILGQNTEIKESNELNYLFRTNEYLKNYLADLQGKRLEWIGNYMENCARIVATKEETKITDDIYELDNDTKITSDDRWASYLTDSNLIGETLNKAILSNASIIVPDDSTKIRIILKYPKISKNRIFTIYESKGMEWNKVVLYDIISNAKDYFMDMINGNAKKSTVCRMFFNKFYVGCTRARDTFIVIENDINDVIIDNLLEKLPKIEDSSQISLYLDGKATCKEWIQETKRFIENKDLSRALYPLLMARTTAKTKEERIQVQKLKRKLSRTNGQSDELVNYGDEAYLEGNYTEAMEFYLTMHKQDMVTICRIMLDKKIEKKEYIESLIDNGMLDEHPEILKHLANQPLVAEMILNAYSRLFGGNK